MPDFSGKQGDNTRPNSIFPLRTQQARIPTSFNNKFVKTQAVEQLLRLFNIR